MAGILALGEIHDGAPTRLTGELASAARSMAEARGSSAAVVLSGADDAAAAEVAAFGATVLTAPAAEPGTPSATNMASLAATLIEQRSPDLVLVGATADGVDVAGALVGMTDLPILVAAGDVRASDGAIVVESSTFGGRLVTTSSFTQDRGIVVLRPGASSASAADTPGAIEAIDAATEAALPPVALVEHITEAAAGPSIDDARIVVSAGRGVGGPDGIALVGALADAFDGALGATRAAVDSGWIDFGQQIGQTGKTVKPDLYLACGVSGAIQHKVGVQSAGTIIAINKDPDAPIAEFADLVVVGDLFEIVPRLTEAVRMTRNDA
jgi:electron transfer flavoprotein alpha subunit